MKLGRKIEQQGRSVRVLHFTSDFDHEAETPGRMNQYILDKKLGPGLYFP